MSELTQIINEARAGKLNWKLVGKFPARMLTTDEAWAIFTANKRNAENRAKAASPQMAQMNADQKTSLRKSGKSAGHSGGVA